MCTHFLLCVYHRGIVVFLEKHWAARCGSVCVSLIDGAAVVLQRERLGQIRAAVNAEQWPMRTGNRAKAKDKDKLLPVLLKTHLM